MSEFSSCISGGSGVLSPSSLLTASSSGSKVTIRDVSTLEVVQIYQCVDKIEKLEFSPDSCYILCSMFARSAVQVFSIADKDWKCRINEGEAGLVNAFWFPDSRQIATESDFGIQMSVWSLVSSTATVLSLPKTNMYGAQGKLSAFSDSGAYFTVVHRIEMQDHIAIYGTQPLAEISKFKARSPDIAVIQWIPSGTHILTADSPMTYKFCVYTPAGELVASFGAYQNALGIRTLSLHERTVQGSMAAIGSYDGKVRMLSMYSWQLAFVLPLVHTKEMDVTMNPDNVVTTVEISASEALTSSLTENIHSNSMLQASTLDTTSIGAHSFDTTKRGSSGLTSHSDGGYVQRSLKALPRAAIASSKGGLPNMGVIWMGWSAHGLLLAAREESYSRCLWIWKPAEAKLMALLVQLESVTCARWCPLQRNLSNTEMLPAILAFCVGTNRLYFWSETNGMAWMDIPASKAAATDGSQVIHAMRITSLQWANDGRFILLKSKDAHATCEVNYADVLGRHEEESHQEL